METLNIILVVVAKIASIIGLVTVAVSVAALCLLLCAGMYHTIRESKDK